MDILETSFQEQSAGYLTNHIARLYALLLTNALNPLGITPGVFPILLALWETDGLTQQQLVEMGDLKQATIANTLARMERDGLISREQHPEDARIRLIYLTDTAKNLETAATHAAKQVNQQTLSVLNDAEQNLFLTMLQRIIAKQRQLLAENQV